MIHCGSTVPGRGKDQPLTVCNVLDLPPVIIWMYAPNRPQVKGGGKVADIDDRKKVV